jgi:hypothetical protein
MTDAEDAAEKWWKEKMAEDVPNNDDLDDLAVAFLDGVERGKDAARARIAELEAAMLRIGQPGKQIVYCRDGHEETVLLARAAYLGEKE